MQDLIEQVRFAALRPGPKLLVLGAVHGNETCGPQAIGRVIDEIRAGNIGIARGEVTFVPVANPKAYRQQTRIGDRNLNRDLHDKPVPQDNEDRIGNRLCALLREHDALLDVHSFRGEGDPFVFFGPPDNDGDLEPFSHAAAESAFAACLGVPVAIHGWLENYAKLIGVRGRLGLPPLSPTEGHGTTEYMRFAGGYGVTIECGRHDDPASADVGYRAILNALALLGISDQPFEQPAPPRVIRMTEVHVCETPGDRMAAEWHTGAPVAAGTVLVRRADGTTVAAPEDGFVIFPASDPQPGDPLCYFGVETPR